MIHERVFGAYVLFTLVRLCRAVGFFSPHSIFYAGTLFLILSGVILTQFHGSLWAWRARLVVYPVLMYALFVNMRWVSPLINDGKRDAALWEVDRLLIGGSLSVMVQPFISPVLTELMSACYMFFMIYLFLSIATRLFSDVSTARIFYAGLFGLYGIGYFGYTLVPAIGPYVVYAGEFAVPLRGWFLTDFLAAAYPLGTNYTDIFPSLHIAVAVYLLMFDMKRNRARFRICVLPCAGICLSTIYLRYHYFVDALAGFALAAAGLYIAKLAERRELSR